MAKRKKRSNTPRYKRMKRQARLQAAPHWLPTYTGKNLVRGYARHFGVDLLCAIAELQLLSIEIDPNYIAQTKLTLINKQRQRAKKKAKQAERKREEQFEECYSYSGFYDDSASMAEFTDWLIPDDSLYGTDWRGSNIQPGDVFF